MLSESPPSQRASRALAYLDEVAFGIKDDSSYILLARHTQLVDVVFAVARLHGFKVNFATNKTEAVVA